MPEQRAQAEEGAPVSPPAKPLRHAFYLHVTANDKPLMFVIVGMAAAVKRSDDIYGNKNPGPYVFIVFINKLQSIIY